MRALAAKEPYRATAGLRPAVAHHEEGGDPADRRERDECDEERPGELVRRRVRDAVREPGRPGTTGVPPTSIFAGARSSVDCFDFSFSALSWSGFGRSRRYLW